MKKLIQSGAGLLAFIILGFCCNWQARADSIVQITAEVQGLEQISYDALAPFGTYWLAIPNATFAPLPCPPADPTLAVYGIADGQYLVDSTAGQLPAGDPVAAMQIESNAVVNLINEIQALPAAPGGRTMDVSLIPPGPGDGGYDTNDYSHTFTNSYIYIFNTNLLWLEITNVSSGTAHANLHNATNQVYAIWSTTNLSIPFTNWQVETEVFPTDTNSMPFSTYTFGRPNLFLRAQDWTGVDSDSDGIPNCWIYYWFGNLNETASDPDSLGYHTVGYDHSHGLNPNIIQFAVPLTNNYASTPSLPLQLNIFAGEPSDIAIMVNDTNAADAIWQPYASANIIAEIGPTNGDYTINVGLRGSLVSPDEYWASARVTLYVTPPLLVLTRPASNTVAQSTLQIQGYANRPLNRLTYDLANATGTFTNQSGFFTGQTLDTNSQRYLTNEFECSGVILASGTNWITFHATDWVGNATNLSFTINYSPNTNAPELNLIWPQSGTPISGAAFTLQAQVNDVSVNISASVNGNTVPGLVEQNGSVWVQNLPLVPGTNFVTLTASNAFGAATSTNFYVVENDVGLVINPLPADQYGQAYVTNTGWIGDPINDSVFVNGIAATVNDDGSWEADNVPVNATGTAILQVQVYVADPVLIAEQTLVQPQPPVVVLAGYAGFQRKSASDGSSWENLSATWAYDAGGSADAVGYNTENLPAPPNYSGTTTWAPDGPGFTLPDLGAEYFGLSLNSDYFNVGFWLSEGSGFFQRNTAAQWLVVNPGLQPAGSTNVYLVLAAASEYANPYRSIEQPGHGTLPLPPTWQALNGQAMEDSGLTNASGTELAAGLLVAGTSTNLILPYTITSFYSNQAASIETLIVTNVMKIVDANSGQDLTAQANTVIVGQQMNLRCQLNSTNFTATSFQWTVPGYAISNYVVAPDASSAMVVTNFPTTNASAIFYWVDGATNRTVQCSATVNGTMITAQATFNVFSPLPEFYLQNQGSVAADANSSAASLDLYFGQNIDMNVGIGMTLTNVPMTNGLFYGGYFVTQLIHTDQKMNVMTGTNVAGWQRERIGLDNEVRYGGIIAIVPEILGFNPIWRDSPSSPLGNPDRWVSRTDSFKDYLMFQPFGIQTIPVPMYIGTWGWSGSAKTNGATGGILLSHTITEHSVSRAAEFPIWSTNTLNVIFSNPANWDTTNLPAFSEN